METKKNKGIAMSVSEKFLSRFAVAVLTILSIIAIIPFLHVISKAVSNGPAVTAGEVFIWPKGFQLDTVRYILTQTKFLNVLKNSLIVTSL